MDDRQLTGLRLSAYCIGFVVCCFPLLSAIKCGFLYFLVSCLFLTINISHFSLLFSMFSQICFGSQSTPDSFARRSYDT